MLARTPKMRWFQTICKDQRLVNDTADIGKGRAKIHTQNTGLQR